jgi:hypothetical protein
VVLAVKEIALDITTRHPGEAFVFASVWLLLGLAGVLAHRRGSLVGLARVRPPKERAQENDDRENP